MVQIQKMLEKYPVKGSSSLDCENNLDQRALDAFTLNFVEDCLLPCMSDK